MDDFGPLARIVRAFLDAKLTAVLVAAVVAGGVLALAVTPREENPRINVPTAIVTTDAQGRSRDEIARLVTVPLERVIGQIGDVEHLYANSQDGRSTITVRYRVGTDPTAAYVDLYTRLLGNRSALPPDAQTPVVSRIDVDDVPVVVLTLASATYDDGALRDLAYRLSDALAPLPGVGTLTLYGGRGRIVNVTIDPARLAGYGVGFAQIDAALRGNAEQPAGYVGDGTSRIDVRAGAPLASVADVANATVGVRAGVPIALGAIATVAPALAPRETYATYSERGAVRDERAVSIAIAKRSGTNVVQVASAVLTATRAFALPAGVRLAVTRNDGAKANAAVNELFQRLLEAIGIVSLLLLVALGWREAAVVAMAIPLTLFITLGVATLAHQTINRITLFALILSLGLLVDDAIVVIENIHRHARAGSRERRELVVSAVAQVASPTILATLTVILAFLPMAFVTGLMGPYMRPIPLDVPIAMLASLAIALVVTPWAAVRILRMAPTVRHAARSRWETTYRRLLGGLLDNRRRARLFVGAVAAALAVAMLLPLAQLVRFRMLPAQNEETFSVAIDEPAGTDLERTRRASAAVEAVLLREPTVRDVETFVGTHAVPDFNGVLRGSFFRDAAWNAELRVNLIGTHERHESSESFVRRMRPALQAAGAPYAAAVRLVEEPPGPPVRATVLGVVSGPDPAVRASIARSVENLVSAEPGVVDVDSSVKQQPVRAHLVVDQRSAALSGVSPQLAATEAAAALGGIASGTVRLPEARDPVPIFLRYGDERRRSLDALAQTQIPSTTAGTVPLASVARVVTERTPAAAIREDRQDVDYVSGEMAGRSSTYAVIDTLLALRRNAAILPGYAVRWDGEWQLTLDVFRDLGLAMAGALVLIYLVLVARFRSLRVPLVVLSAVPLGLIGVMPGFALLAPFGVYFSATAMIGVIALAGIVVRNSIVLVEFVEERLAQGAPLREALIDAGSVRARPIALTAAAGMLSAVVIAFDPVWSGLAWALVFGMGASAVLSLFIVPLLYAAVARPAAAQHAAARANRTPLHREEYQPA
ncbi:multidrug transporter AcrB [Vulcanimicrobium alpinum]|uniref:Multidrug transporter AcrB n=1 Tax=Vulcanimicrobium alpinum TaxID=3016050 RepID=A0AAN2C8L4_UNVUL|nr:efflux RND transporter permease subunit [Vulcanimicrobium alpinum]BDE05640.1 multidrug transporter AcrB [Vulcanimicrobium alpinum]